MKEEKLKEFFNPKTIAIIGASEKERKVGNILMKKNGSFKGELIPINKKTNIIEGKIVYKRVKDYKQKIDLAVIAIPSKQVKRALKECAKKGIKNIIIISAGFKEIKNYSLENKLIKIIKKYSLNVLGPNCFGIANPKLNLDLTFSNFSPKKGTTAFISQSGALGSYIFDNDIKVSGFISLGNMAGLEFTDWIEYFDNDKSTKKIVCYIEQLKDGKKFIKLCRQTKKEIVVVKSGKTEKGKIATISHTGSLGTQEEIYTSAFKQAKVKEKSSIISAFNLEEEKLEFKESDKQVLIITNAGGASAILVDKLEKLNIEVTGPIDLLGTASGNDYKKALHKIERNYDKIIVILTPQKMSEPEKTATAIVESRFKEKIIPIFLGKKSLEKANSILKENNLKPLNKII